MREFIPYGRQSIDEGDIQAVAKALKDELLTTGGKVAEFENALCKETGAKYCVAVSNGTAALHLASLALLNSGDKVLTTPNSFLATSNSILYAGAKPVFIDIEADGGIDLTLCEEALKKDDSIKAIYPVHFSGKVTDQEKLKYLRQKYGIKIVEDCAHSLGGFWQNGDKRMKAASCENSDAAILSFHPVKHITTGEGGAITTNDETLYKKLQRLRNHGITRDAVEFENSEMAYDKSGTLNPWYYEMHSLGFNYRLTDIQCALGLSQLKKLEKFLERRRQIAKRYCEAFQDHSLIRPLFPYDESSAYHLFVVLIDFETLKMSRAAFINTLKERGVGSQVHYIPINSQPYYRKLGYGGESFQQMTEYYSKCLSLPIYPAMSDKDVEYVIEKVLGLLGG